MLCLLTRAGPPTGLTAPVSHCRKLVEENKSLLSELKEARAHAQRLAEALDTEKEGRERAERAMETARVEVIAAQERAARAEQDAIELQKEVESLRYKLMQWQITSQAVPIDAVMDPGWRR